MNRFEKGVYVIGDPCLCTSAQFASKYDLLDNPAGMFSGILDLEDGGKLAMYELSTGYCWLFDNNQNRYPILSSSLAVIPYRYCKDCEELVYGHLYSFDSEFQKIKPLKSLQMSWDMHMDKKWNALLRSNFET